MAKLAFALALALAAAGCKEAVDDGPMPQPTRAPPAGFEDVDTAERPDAAPRPRPDAGSNRPRRGGERDQPTAPKADTPKAGTPKPGTPAPPAGAAKREATIQVPRGTSKK